MVNLRPIIPSFLILVWLSAGEVWADYADPLPLENAILAYSADERGWAYDEVVTAYNRKGKISEVRATRVDPSRPWDQRELLISTEQGPATDRQKKKFQKGREKERRRIELGLEDRRRLRDRMNFPLSVIDAENEQTCEYHVPLLPDEETGFPTDKIRMVVNLDPTDETLQKIDARLTEAVRHKAVAKVKDLHLTIEFSRPLPDEEAVALIKLRGQAAASVLFFPVGGEVQLERSNFRRVTPYDDRFEVQVGPATTLDF
ncbi:hypothetical protein N9K67_08175 [Opitutaceae bacterium]|nr:hypothetical protein [Opitutaceae bacterium]